jgi:hypothetical protein
LSEEFGAIGGAAVGEDAADGDGVILVKGDSLAESGQHVGGAFVGEEAGEAEAGVIVDGDVETLDAGARIALGSVPVARTPGRAKRPSFLMSRWRRSPG